MSMLCDSFQKPVSKIVYSSICSTLLCMYMDTPEQTPHLYGVENPPYAKPEMQGGSRKLQPGTDFLKKRGLYYSMRNIFCAGLLLLDVCHKLFVEDLH